VAHGLEISPHRLQRIGHAEAALRAGLPAGANIRVRDLGTTVRIETDPQFVDRLREDVLSQQALTGAGFDADWSVTPFRSGSLNDALGLDASGGA